jgi:hypothetical protein
MEYVLEIRYAFISGRNVRFSVHFSTMLSVDSDAQASKRRKLTADRQSLVVRAEELCFQSHAFLQPIYNNKQKGYRSVKVTKSETNTSPVLVQFDSKSGRIPANFGVDTNQHGRTYLTFDIPCDKEYEALIRFQEDIKTYAKVHKEEWWSYPVSDAQVDDNFAGMVSIKKEKKEGGGFWPGNMKVCIPLDETTGLLKDCSVVDEEGKAISVHDLPGRKWAVVLIEISGVYFQNRFNWGLGPKTLRLVKTAVNDRVEYIPGEIDYLELVLQKKSENPVCLGDIEYGPVSGIIPDTQVDTDVPVGDDIGFISTEMNQEVSVIG